MTITDEEFNGLLACFDPQNVPSDPVAARQAMENFVDLVEVLIRPLPLPPACGGCLVVSVCRSHIEPTADRSHSVHHEGNAH